METNWLTVVSSVVNVGFSVVVGIYLLTKAIPKMQEDHNKQLNEQRDDFLKEIKDKRNDFVTELKEISAGVKASEQERRAESRTLDQERKTEHKEALAAVLAHCERESERRDRIIQVEMSMISKSLNDQGQGVQELTEAIRELKSVVEKVSHA